jgi:hypothetical protein
VVRDERLRHDVVLVDAEVIGGHVERHEPLDDGKAPELWHHHLGDEAPAVHQMSGGVLEARHLSVLGEQVHDRVEHDVDDTERAVDPGRRHVTAREGDAVTTGPAAQRVQHRPREVDATDRHASLGERDGDPAGPDPELERRSSGRELGEQVDGRSDDVRPGHLGDVVVVDRRLLRGPHLAVHPDSLASPAGTGRRGSARSSCQTWWGRYSQCQGSRGTALTKP